MRIGSETLVCAVNFAYLAFCVLCVLAFFLGRILGDRLGYRPGGQP
jgi:hypothetical protein